MAMTPEEKRAKNRERQARYRARQREQLKLEALPRIGPGARDGRVTGDAPGMRTVATSSNEAAASAVIESLEVPATAVWRTALVLQLARDLDVPGAIPQRAGLAQRYAENLEALIAAAKPVERDALDEMRRSFYRGEVAGIDDDPEAKGRRKRA